MIWTVVYRDKDGKSGRLEMEAANRAVVFSEMREKECQVISITDGADKYAMKGGGSGGKKKKRSEPRGSGFLFLILLVVAAGAVWYFCFGPGVGWIDKLKGGYNPIKPRPPGKISVSVNN